MTNSENILQKPKDKKEVSVVKFGSSPQADWKIIFLITLGLIVIVSTLNGFLFFRVNSGAGLGGGVVVGDEENALSITKLQEALTYYQAKGLEFEVIKTAATTTNVVDPSL